MAAQSYKRVGIIGFGQIGSSLYGQLSDDPGAGFQVAGILETDQEAATKAPPDLLNKDLAGLLQKSPDLVVEAAHPQAVRSYACSVLQSCDLMIMSVSALGDQSLERDIQSACRDSGHRLFIPHGATLGLDGLRDGLSIWEEVSITMRKNPRNLNFGAAPHLEPEASAAETVVYDGPTRGILPLFPKNVNSHATLALATLGLDQTRSILISDPGLDESVIEIDATGGGTKIHIERRNPIKGVTGKLTILSLYQSIQNAIGEPGIIIPC
ncbi:MAG: DUF108 domain-containing protein [Desulfarculaceae bacterium]|jgi:aspartate dehydrogenase